MTDNIMLQSFIVEKEEQLPQNLRSSTSPFVLRDVEMVTSRPITEICDKDGRVKMSSAVEFTARATPGLLNDFCDPEEVYQPGMIGTRRFRCVYDPEIQRGLKPDVKGAISAKEFLRESEIESMMTDIEENKFHCPSLNWNLRAGKTSWAYIIEKRELRIYQGVATRPDTNHRHHAIIRYHKKYLDWIGTTEATSFGTYNPDREYQLTIYTDDYEAEAHRFYVFNFLGWRVSPTTAHYIESKTASPAIHHKLARSVMEQSGILGLPNVEVVQGQLSKNSAKMLTFGTLTDALKMGFPGLTEGELDATRDHVVKFLEQLGAVRPQEIARLSVAQRQAIRNKSIADQAVMWHGYIRLAAALKDRPNWQESLKALGEPIEYRARDGSLFNGDLFDRNNPLLLDVGIAVPGKKGVRIQNVRQSRQAAFELLRDAIEGKYKPTSAAGAKAAGKSRTASPAA